MVLLMLNSAAAFLLPHPLLSVFGADAFLAVLGARTTAKVTVRIIYSTTGAVLDTRAAGSV